MSYEAGFIKSIVPGKSDVTTNGATSPIDFTLSVNFPFTLSRSTLSVNSPASGEQSIININVYKDGKFVSNYVITVTGG